MIIFLLVCIALLLLFGAEGFVDLVIWLAVIAFYLLIAALGFALVAFIIAG